MLSHLTAFYIKQSLDTLSALCCCIVAEIGSSVGITYLMTVSAPPLRIWWPT
jgi:L-cysteine desulfidase